MRKIIVLASLALSFSAAHALTPQQERMGQCNKAATGKAGQERKDFMKTCLSDGRVAQQQKMKTCNAEATGKKGDERKAFMSACLKK